MKQNGGQCILRYFLTLAALLLVSILTVPIECYRLFCRMEPWQVHYLEGPMRDEYAGRLAELLAKEDFTYIKIGNEIFVKVIYPFHFFNRPPQWDTLYNFLTNTEHRIAKSIAAGYGPNGTRISPPSELLSTLAKIRALYKEKNILNLTE